MVLLYGIKIPSSYIIYSSLGKEGQVMTEEYVSKFTSGLLRYNRTDSFYRKRIYKMSLFCAAGILAGILLEKIFPCKTEDITLIGTSHFSSFFDGLSPLQFIRACVKYALPDFFSVLITAIFGYTMLACVGGAAVLVLKGARFGYCFCSLLQISSLMTSGTQAFILFALSKFIVLFALVFVASEAEGFSYVCRDIYGKPPYTLVGEKSHTYIVLSLSAAGFTAIINAIYLVMIHFQDITML